MSKPCAVAVRVTDSDFQVDDDVREFDVVFVVVVTLDGVGVEQTGLVKAVLLTAIAARVQTDALQEADHPAAATAAAARAALHFREGVVEAAVDLDVCVIVVELRLLGAVVGVVLLR